MHDWTPDPMYMQARLSPTIKVDDSPWPDASTAGHSSHWQILRCIMGWNGAAVAKAASPQMAREMDMRPIVTRAKLGGLLGLSSAGRQRRERQG